VLGAAPPQLLHKHVRRFHAGPVGARSSTNI
jgi:hypothetical protein